MATGDPQYWTTLTRVELLIHRLQAFLSGGETHESLQAWAKALWIEQESPVSGHAAATAILMNLWNAATREPPGDDSCPYILRRIDVDAYLYRLQRGDQKLPTHDLGCLHATPADIAARLGRETERYILDGIGWCDYLRFASPGSGRVFVLERPLRAVARGSWVYVDQAADPLDTARDLFEALTIDLADLDAFASRFIIDPAALPRWTLWHQDDHGARRELASFTSRRKAEAALRRHESPPHKQFHWLEDPS
jgi:hypothetical protein